MDSSSKFSLCWVTSHHPDADGLSRFIPYITNITCIQLHSLWLLLYITLRAVQLNAPSRSVMIRSQPCFSIPVCLTAAMLRRRGNINKRICFLRLHYAESQFLRGTCTPRLDSAIITSIAHS